MDLANKHGILLPVINLQKCTGCNKCVKACKKDVLELINIAKNEGKRKFFNRRKMVANIKNPMSCDSCGICVMICKHNAIEFYKKCIILIMCIMMTTFAYSNKLKSDTLQLDQAIFLSVKRKMLDVKDSFNLAADEKEIIHEVFIKYCNYYYKNECYKIFIQTENLIHSKLEESNCQSNLFFESIKISLEIGIIKQNHEMILARKEFYELLGIKDTCNFYLEAPCNGVFQSIKADEFKRINMKLSKQISDYNNQVCLVQKLNIRKMIFEKFIDTSIKNFDINFFELELRIQNYLRYITEYYKQLFQLKKLYMTFVKNLIY